MKYQLNLNPNYCKVTAIELIDGRKGTIIYVAMHENESVIYTNNGVIDFSECSEKILANFNESMKECLNRKYLLPLDELEEVIEIENEHRASNL